MIVVTTKISATASAFHRLRPGVTVTESVTAPRAGAITIESWNGGAWHVLALTLSLSTSIADDAGQIDSYSYQARGYR